MPRRCDRCFRPTPDQPVNKCPHCGKEFSKVATRTSSSGLLASDPRASTLRTYLERRTSSPVCPYKLLCAEFLTSLQWPESLFDRRHNRCYCNDCYPDIFKDTYETGGSTYVVPRDWCRFGLHVDEVRADVDEIWEKWIVTYHGTSAAAAQSIVLHRQFLIPGDKCIDGKLLRIRPGHIKDKYEIYTSPTIAYSSHRAYCPIEKFQSKTTGEMYNARVVLQCRQQPGSYIVQGETVGAKGKRICPLIPNDQVEILTTVRAAIVPYGILIHVAKADD